MSVVKILSRKPVKVYLERAECECGGEMVKTGMGITTNEPSWAHTCTTCGARAWYPVSYPHIAFDEDAL